MYCARRPAQPRWNRLPQRTRVEVLEKVLPFIRNGGPNRMRCLACAGWRCPEMEAPGDIAGCQDWLGALSVSVSLALS